MIYFNAIKEATKNVELEYGWNKPQTFIVLIPVISLVFLKIQIYHLKDKLKLDYPNYRARNQFYNLWESREYKKIEDICKWHKLGSHIQSIALCALSCFNPLFLLPMVFSICELSYTLVLENFRGE